MLDDVVGIDVGGRGKLSIHPKLDVWTLASVRALRLPSVTVQIFQT